jgi:ABC-type phosphate transport system substrate-binding protein
MSSARTIAAAFALLLGVSALAAEPSFKVIIHDSNPVRSMSRADVASLFLRKKTQWPSGAHATPVDLSDSSAARAAFSQAVLQKSVSGVKSYWRHLVFAGRGVPPSEKSSEQDVVQVVKSDPNAIGYVSGAADLSGTRVLEITD